MSDDLERRLQSVMRDHDPDIMGNPWEPASRSASESHITRLRPSSRRWLMPLAAAAAVAAFVGGTIFTVGHHPANPMTGQDQTTLARTTGVDLTDTSSNLDGHVHWWTPTGGKVATQEEPFVCGQPMPEFATLGPDKARLTFHDQSSTSSEAYVSVQNLMEDQLAELATESVIVFLGPGTQDIIGMTGTDTIPEYDTIGFDQSIRLRYLSDARDCRFEPARSLPDGVYRAYIRVTSKSSDKRVYRIPVRARVTSRHVALLEP